MNSQSVSQNVLAFDEKTIKRLDLIVNSTPLFIVGCPRSGTTLVLRLIRDYLNVGFGRDDGRFLRLGKHLDRYSDLSNAENLDRLVRDIFDDEDFRKRFKGLSVDPQDFATLLKKKTYAELVRHIYAAFALINGKTRWGGKTPRYVFHLGELHNILPDAKFIHVIRDGRDVALSLFRMPWGAPRNAYAAAKYWKACISAAHEYKHNLSAEEYLEVKYEALLTDPVRVFQEMFDFGCFDLDRDQVIQKFQREIHATLKKDNYNKWMTNMNSPEIKIFEQVAGDMLVQLGYEVQNPDLVGQPLRLDQKVYYNGHNLARRIKTEGKFGVAAALKRRFS